MYSYLVNDNSEDEKAKVVNRNALATVSHNEYKNVLLSKECLKYLMSRIESKDNSIWTYEINKTSLFCFDHKIYIKNKRYNGLALGYQR